MKTFTVGTKGQVTLGKDLMRHLGVRPGGNVIVEKLLGGRVEIKAAPPTGDISDAFGFLKKSSPSLSAEDINKLAARGWAGKR